MSVFSDRLKKLRDEKGWTKTYVANHLGLARMQVYANWEYGSREPDYETIKNLANLFGVTTDYLIGRTDSRTSDTQIDRDLEHALDNAHSFEGKPISDRYREVVKGNLRSYFQ